MDVVGANTTTQNFFSQRAKFAPNRFGKKSNQLLIQKANRGMLNKNVLPGIMSSDYVNRDTKSSPFEGSSLIKQVTIRENGVVTYAVNPTRSRVNFDSQQL